MMKLIADSSSDRPAIAGAEVQYVPLVVSTDHVHFVDDETLDVRQMLDTLSAHRGRSYTACPSVDGWLTAFDGGDEIYAVTITSALSGSYNAAMAARELYLQEHPGAKVAVFDSLSTGPELRLILEKLQERDRLIFLFFARTAKDGLSEEQVAVRHRHRTFAVECTSDTAKRDVKFPVLRILRKGLPCGRHVFNFNVQTVREFLGEFGIKSFICACLLILIGHWPVVPCRSDADRATSSDIFEVRCPSFACGTDSQCNRKERCSSDNFPVFHIFSPLLLYYVEGARFSGAVWCGLKLGDIRLQMSDI